MAASKSIKNPATTAFSVTVQISAEGVISHAISGSIGIRRADEFAGVVFDIARAVREETRSQLSARW